MNHSVRRHGDIESGQSTYIDTKREYVIIMFRSSPFNDFCFCLFTLQPKGKHRWARIGMDRVYVAKNVTRPWHPAAIRSTKENLIVIIRVTLLCSDREVSCKWRVWENDLRIDNLIFLCLFIIRLISKPLNFEGFEFSVFVLNSICIVEPLVVMNISFRIFPPCLFIFYISILWNLNYFF